MTAYLLVAYDVFGYLLGAAFGLAMLGILAWYQWHEYRRWPYSARSFWVIKIGTPLFFGLCLLAVMAGASNVSGMEGLAVFYLGGFLLIGFVPLATALASRLLGISFKEALTSSGSLFTVLLGLAFALSMLVSTGRELLALDLAYQLEKYQTKINRDNPTSIGELATFRQEDWYRLPDGQWMLVVSISFADSLEVEKIDVKLASNNRQANVRHFCERNGELTVAVVTRESREVGLKTLWRTNNSDFYIAENSFVRPEQPRFLQVYHHNGDYDIAPVIGTGSVSLFVEESWQSFVDHRGEPVIDRRFMKEKMYAADFSLETDIISEAAALLSRRKKFQRGTVGATKRVT